MPLQHLGTAPEPIDLGMIQLQRQLMQAKIMSEVAQTNLAKAQELHFGALVENLRRSAELQERNLERLEEERKTAAEERKREFEERMGMSKKELALKEAEFEETKKRASLEEAARSQQLDLLRRDLEYKIQRDLTSDAKEAAKLEEERERFQLSSAMNLLNTFIGAKSPLEFEFIRKTAEGSFKGNKYAAGILELTSDPYFMDELKASAIDPSEVVRKILVRGLNSENPRVKEAAANAYALLSGSQLVQIEGGGIMSPAAMSLTELISKMESKQKTAPVVEGAEKVPDDKQLAARYEAEFRRLMSMAPKMTKNEFVNALARFRAKLEAVKQ